MTKSMKDIYTDGIALATILNGWKQTGFILTGSDESVYDVAKRAIASAEEILPGIGLSFVLSVGESLLGTKDGEALERFLRSDIDLVATLTAELSAHTSNGTV